MPTSPEGAALLKARIERFGFTLEAIRKFAESCRDGCRISEHLGSRAWQTT